MKFIRTNSRNFPSQFFHILRFLMWEEIMKENGKHNNKNNNKKKNQNFYLENKGEK